MFLENNICFQLLYYHFRVLQNDRDNIAIKSKSFLSNIKKTINKIMLHIHKKYIKIRNKLNKRVCYLKNQYPNDKGLKLTENNQLFDDKYCFGKTSRKLNDETATKDDTKYKKNNKRKEHYDQQDNLVTASFIMKVLQDLKDSATPKKVYTSIKVFLSCYKTAKSKSKIILIGIGFDFYFVFFLFPFFSFRKQK